MKLLASLSAYRFSRSPQTVEQFKLRSRLSYCDVLQNPFS